MLIVIKMQRYGNNSKPPNTLLIIMLKCINAKRAQRGLTPLRPSQFFYTNNSPDAAESETLHLSQISEIVAPLEDSP